MKEGTTTSNFDLDDYGTIKDYVTIKTPNYVGGYRIGESGSYFQFNLTYKPNWFHRTMMRLCLGYEWVNL